MDAMTDRALTCADCGMAFAFSASEQQFYADRQFSDPRRCPSCRASRKLSRGGFGGGDQASGGQSSGRYSGGGYSGGSGGFTGASVRCSVPRAPAADVRRMCPSGRAARSLSTAATASGPSDAATDSRQHPIRARRVSRRAP